MAESSVKDKPFRNDRKLLQMNNVKAVFNKNRERRPAWPTHCEWMVIEPNVGNLVTGNLVTGNLVTVKRSQGNLVTVIRSQGNLVTVIGSQGPNYLVT